MSQTRRATRSRKAETIISSQDWDEVVTQTKTDSTSTQPEDTPSPAPKKRVTRAQAAKSGSSSSDDDVVADVQMGKGGTFLWVTNYNLIKITMHIVQKIH